MAYKKARAGPVIRDVHSEPSNVVVGSIIPRPRRKKARESKSNENHNLYAQKNIEKITINKRKNEWFDGDPLAGFIFLCSGEVKSEGYKKGIFGLPYWELDTVKKIKEGANLFLYDIDLKLLYGIYEATSDGGYCLDPSPFGGTFHAQVKIGCCTLDVLKHLSSEEISRIPTDGTRDRMGRLAIHVLKQCSFYPLYPPSKDVPLDLSLSPESLQITSVPDILILPSDLAPFVK